MTSDSGSAMQQRERETDSSTRQFVHEISHGLFNAVPDALLLVDADGHILLANAATTGLFGYRPDELIGLPVETLVPEALRGAHQRHRARYQAGASVRPMSNRSGLQAMRKDGSFVTVEISLSPLQTSRGPLTVCAVRDGTERERIAQALQLSENRFRTLVEQATDGIFLSDDRGVYVAVNDAACSMVGYPRSLLVGMSISDLIVPNEAARLPAEIARLANGAPTKSEWQFRRRDGTTFVGEVNARRLPDSRLLAVLRDVTERKRHEDDQERARRFIEAVAKASPSWIYVFDLDDQSLRYLNRSILRDLGYPPDAERLTNLADFARFIPEDERARLPVLLDEWRRLNDDEIHSAEYRVRDANGAVRWCYGREIVFSRHADGRVHQVLGTLDDVTARRDADDALRRSEQRWQFALESAGDGMWDWDPQTGAAFYSARWKEMLGYDLSEVSGNRVEWSSRVHPDDLGDATAAIEAHLRGETPHFVNEQRMRCRDGRWLWVLDRGRVVERNAAGRPSRVVGTLTDITPLKLAITQLRESEERFRSLIEELDVGVLLQDAVSDRILMANRAAEAMLGIPGPELSSLSSHTWPWRLLREDRSQYARGELPSVVAAETGETVRDQIVGSYNVDTGVCRWLQVTAMPRRELDGTVRHVLVTLTDVTSRKTAEDALVAARETWERSFNALTDWVSVLDRE